MIATNSIEDMTETDPYLGAFDRLENDPAQPAWLLPVRKAGLARFSEIGYPTPEHEDWRFTNVSAISRMPFRPAGASASGEVSAEFVDAQTFAGIPGSRLVFVDGRFDAGLSKVNALPAGASVGNLASALESGTDLIRRHFNQRLQAGEDAFALLNTAFFSDGAFIHVPADVSIDEPVRVVHVATRGARDGMVLPRNLIIAEAGSRLTVLESYVSAGNDAYVTNSATEIAVGDRAVVEYLKFQDEGPAAHHIANLHGEFGRSSRVNLHSFALGGRLSRNNIRTRLAGDGLECVLNGLYLTRGQQLADHHMIVEHARPNCASHEYFNGILDDQSRGVFHGRILVRPVAQKTDAKQTNKNLLLSEDAVVNTKPQLEIYADDVRCTHGATVGQMNDQSIFYLRSRGIGLDRARQMLMHAFAGEIIDRVTCEAAREELDELVWNRLEENPAIREARPVSSHV